MRRLIFIPILLICMAPSCPDALEKIAKGLNVAAVSTGEVQTVVIEASDLDMITKEESDAFIKAVTVPILVAIGKANTTVELLLAMDEKDRDELVEVLPPVIESVKEALADEKIGLITNDATQASVQLGLQSILAALNIIQATTEVSR